MTKEPIVAKVSLPHPKSAQRRYFVRNRNKTFTYRGPVPLSVRRAVERSPQKEVFFTVVDRGAEMPQFMVQLEDQEW